MVEFLGFAFMFGAGDNTQVTFEAQQLSAAEVVADISYEPPEDVQPLVDRTVENGSSRSVIINYQPVFEDAPARQVHGEGAAQYVYAEQAGTFYRIAVTDTVGVIWSGHFELSVIPRRVARGGIGRNPGTA